MSEIYKLSGFQQELDKAERFFSMHLTRQELKKRLDEIERLNNILDEIDLMFYRMRFVGFNSTKDEIKFLYIIINDVRKMCQNKKLLEENK